ncbi:MAG: hypothetical protein JWM89_1802 [Acidimicrobiales bacterium]|nr:hypothetical protein [Acidimicrobiales bacterium]
MAEPGLVHLELKDAAKITAAQRACPRAMAQQQRTWNRQTAKLTAGWIRSATTGGTPQQRHMAKGIRATATANSSIIAIANGASSPGALGAFVGSRRWHQFPEWVGTGWAPGDANAGPYIVNPTLHRHEADIQTLFLQGQLEAAARPFPRL